MKVLLTLMLLITLPFMMIIGIAGVIMCSITTVFDQIVRIWSKPTNKLK